MAPDRAIRAAEWDGPFANAAELFGDLRGRIVSNGDEADHGGPAQSFIGIGAHPQRRLAGIAPAAQGRHEHPADFRLGKALGIPQAAPAGEGEARVGGVRLPARDALARAGLEPFVLGPKEGLALLNGTQVSTALALHGLFGAESVFAAGLVAGALSLEAIKGSIAPLDGRMEITLLPPNPERAAVVGMAWNAVGDCLFAAHETGIVTLFTLTSIRSAIRAR